MNKPEIVTTVVETIAKVQELSGRSSAGIGASTCPIGGVEGFDSLSGVEATIILAESLGVDLPGDYNPLHLRRWEAGVVDKRDSGWPGRPRWP